MAKIKVLHLTYDMRIGGTEQVIKTLVENADYQQFDMSILGIESPLGPFAADLLAKGITITALSRRPGFDFKLIKQIHTYIKQHNIDILHCHQYTPWVYGVLAAFTTKAKVIFTEHGRFYPDSSSWKRKLINPWLHRITTATTAISSATRDALSVYENLPRGDIQVIYNGISPVTVSSVKVKALREELGITDGTICLGTIARFDPIKNHPMMLRAFKYVLDKGINAKLIIVGDGEMCKTIESIINELELKKHIVMTGYQTKPHAYLALMDIYLLSSFSEGTSMTLLEAMSLGKPCVVTETGGSPEVVVNQVNGLVTSNDNATEFGKAMLVLANSKELRAEMAKRSLARFEDQFSAASMTNQFQSLYADILPIC